MPMINKVAVAGASGDFGSKLLSELLSSNKFNIVVLTRLDSQSTFPSSVKVIKTDYTPDSLNKIFAEEQFDAAMTTINSLKPGAAESDNALIHAAKAHGVKRFLPCEFGVDTSSKELGELVPLMANKVKTIQLLRSLESETFTWTAIICGLWFDWGLRLNGLVANFKEKKFQRFDGGDHPFTTTNQATVGKAIVNLLSDDDKLAATTNKHVYISSHTVTTNQVIAAVQKVTGEEWPVDEVDSGVLEGTATQALQGGNFTAVQDLFKLGIFGKRRLGDYSKLVSNDLLGLPKEDFEAQVKDIVVSVLQKGAAELPDMKY